jgi:hypothetical protein
MTRQVAHQVPGTGPADIALALAVAGALHEPLTAARAAEATGKPAVARFPQLMGLRTSAARPHRRRVPLNRLSTVTV